jgi:hypothetical protein
MTKEQLSVTKGWGVNRIIRPITDVDDNPIHAGDLVMLVSDTTWHKEGEILRVTSVSAGDQTDFVYVESPNGSSTAVPEEACRVASTPETEREFRVSFLRFSLSSIQETIAALTAKQSSLKHQLREMGEEV